jgi:isocitrate dehydrogenase kinase/phosphatase
VTTEPRPESLPVDRVLAVFEQHVGQVLAISHGARRRFERRMGHEQWAANHQREVLRERALALAARELRLAGPLRAAELTALPELAARRIRGAHHRDWAAAFGAQVVRRLGEGPEVVGAPGLDPSGGEPLEDRVGVRVHRGSPRQVAAGVFDQMAWDLALRDRDGDRIQLAAAIEAAAGGQPFELLVHLEPLFRNRSAFVLALLRDGRREVPIGLGLDCDRRGIGIESLVVDAEPLGRWFDATRTPVMTPALDPETTAEFLAACAPQLPRDEAFRAVGLTEIAEELQRDELARCLLPGGRRLRVVDSGGDALIWLGAEGCGKALGLLRDGRPDPAERAEVLRRIGWTRRAGRVLDTREIRRLLLPTAAFEPDSLRELCVLAPASLHGAGAAAWIVLDPVFVRRALVPLEVHLAAAVPEIAERATADQRRALLDLAGVGLRVQAASGSCFGVLADGRVVLTDPCRLQRGL